MSYHKVIGIDLGTTCSVVSVWDYDNGNVVVIPTADGENALPSVLGVDDEGKVVVGRRAQDRSVPDPKSTIAAVNRLMGTSAARPVRLGDRDYPPQGLAAFVLAELKRQAEAFLGEPVHDAVISVPAWFGTEQRRATQEAGIIAGLNVRLLLIEPVAAVVSFGEDQVDDGRTHLYAIFDFGGNTLDVSVVEVGGGCASILGMDGTTRFGGEEFDGAITDWALEEIIRRHAVDLRRDDTVRARIKNVAERCKRQLTAANTAALVLPGLAPNLNVTLTLTRAVFDGLIDDRSRAATDCLNKAIASAARARSVDMADIERVLLVGGSARIPRVRMLVAESMSHLEQKDFAIGINPEEAVSSGAAMVARKFNPSDAFIGTEVDAATSGSIAPTDKDEPVALLLQDVTSHTLGILVNEQDFHPIIPKETRIPAESTMLWATRGGVAPSADVLILEGEDNNAFHNKLIGRLTVPLPRPTPDGLVEFAVTFRVDSSGLLQVVVKRHGDDQGFRYQMTYDTRSARTRIDDGADLARVMAPPAHPTCNPPVTIFSARLDENVQFTVFRPASVAAGRWYPLLAFAHLSDRRPDASPADPDPVQEVRRQAEAMLAEDAASYSSLTQDSSHAVPQEGELTFAPVIAGVEFNPPRRTFLWQEDVHREEFRMRAAPSLEGQVARGRLTVFLGSIIIADVSLSVRVGGEEASRPVRASAGVYRKIFASYSHRDVAIVEACEHYARAFGDQYVRDMVHLRTGEVWDDRLRQMIEEADVFQLFWSRNSLRSRFVRQEWEHALSLRQKGPSFIRPVYWEEPLPADPEQDLPPEKLRRVHFQRLSVDSSETACPSLLKEHLSEVVCGRRQVPRLREKLDLAEAKRQCQAGDELLGVHQEALPTLRAPARDTAKELPEVRVASTPGGSAGASLESANFAGVPLNAGPDQGLLEPFVTDFATIMEDAAGGLTSTEHLRDLQMRLGDLRERTGRLRSQVQSVQGRACFGEFSGALDRAWVQLQKIESEVSAFREISDLRDQLVSLIADANSGVRSIARQRSLKNGIDSIQAAIERLNSRLPSLGKEGRAAIHDLGQAVAKNRRILDENYHTLADAEFLNPVVARYNDLLKSAQTGIHSPEALHDLYQGMCSLADYLRGADGRLHTASAQSNLRDLTAVVDHSLRRLASMQESNGRRPDPFRKIVVLLVLSAASVVSGMSWWQRIHWVPLATGVRWGSWVLAVLFALWFLTALATAVSKKHTGRPAVGSQNSVKP